MGPFDHLDTGFGLYFFDNHLFVGAVIHDARANMDLGDFLSHGRIPEIYLGQTRDDGRTGTVPAIQQPCDFGIRVFVYTELSIFSVKSHQAPAAPDAHVIHGFFTPDNQYFFHVISFHLFILKQPFIYADAVFLLLICKPYASLN
jgi:hypothetical protein